MDDYMKGILDEAPANMDGVVLTPVAEHLFDVNEDAESLDLAQAELFHHLTAKLLFLCKWAQPDIQTAVAFLTTQVKGPDTNDYKKLAHMIRYCLCGVLNLALMLEADNMHIIKWWVDVSFAVHSDMKSHMGGTMSLGKGSAHSTSTRHKINTKSSTKTKLMAVNNVMPLILWTQYFLEAQGYEVCKNKVF